MLREWCGIAKDGVSLYGLDTAAKQLGFETCPTLVTATELETHFNGLCIIHWNQKHFMVYYKITNKKSASYFYIVDLGQGFCKFSYEEFHSHFETEKGKGVALLLSPGDDIEHSPSVQKILGQKQSQYYKVGILFLCAILLLLGITLLSLQNSLKETIVSDVKFDIIVFDEEAFRVVKSMPK